MFLRGFVEVKRGEVYRGLSSPWLGGTWIQDMLVPFLLSMMNEVGNK